MTQPAPTFAHSFSAVRLIPWWAWIIVGFILLPVMGWSSVSITVLTHALGIPWWCAWIPAAATDGVMLLTTPWAVNELLDQEIRIWAGSVATTGIVGSVICGFVEHYLNPADETIGNPWLAGAVGAIPPLMAAVVVHIIFMILRQQNRMHREAEEAGRAEEQTRILAEKAVRERESAQAQADLAERAAERRRAKEIEHARELSRIEAETAAAKRAAADAEREAEQARTKRAATVEQALARPTLVGVPTRKPAKPAPKQQATAGRRSDKADNARRYLIRQLRDERRDPDSITATEVDRAIGAVSVNGKPTGYSNRNLAGWLKEVQDFLARSQTG